MGAWDIEARSPNESGPASCGPGRGRSTRSSPSSASRRAVSASGSAMSPSTRRLALLEPVGTATTAPRTGGRTSSPGPSRPRSPGSRPRAAHWSVSWASAISWSQASPCTPARERRRMGPRRSPTATPRWSPSSVDGCVTSSRSTSLDCGSPSTCTRVSISMRRRPSGRGWPMCHARSSPRPIERCPIHRSASQSTPWAALAFPTRPRPSIGRSWAWCERCYRAV